MDRRNATTGRTRKTANRIRVPRRSFDATAASVYLCTGTVTATPTVKAKKTRRPIVTQVNVNSTLEEFSVSS